MYGDASNAYVVRLTLRAWQATTGSISVTLDFYLRLLMCGIVVSVAIKEPGEAGANTSKENDVWETLVRLNTPRGARRFTSVPSAI